MKQTHNTTLVIKIIGIVSFIFSVCFILYSCKKGSNDSDLDVSGGRVINDDVYPSVVRLVNDGYCRCTGSIISSNVVLTAAHCTENKGWVYRNQNDPVSVYKVEANPNYNPEWNKFSGDAFVENFKNDVAVWVIKDRAFKNHPQKLQISDIDLREVDEVRLVGWGCETSMTIEEVVEKVSKYKKYTLQCKEGWDTKKRTGTNTDIFVSEDDSSMTIYDETVDEIDGVKQKGEGVGALLAPGDSGGPWIAAENGISTNKIMGVNSHGTIIKYDREYCSQHYDRMKRDEFLQWMGCAYFSATAINPVSSYNMSFLEYMVDTYKAIIPGIQIGVRVIEYNGKIKVLYKEESTSFNTNVKEHSVIKSFNNTSYSTVSSLKKAWRNTNFYERSKASWIFE